jgi:hypothetical protein
MLRMYRGMLTGGGGLARIDVADNDHVDVHLFLTAEQQAVSKQSIKICSRCETMLLVLRWQEGAWCWRLEADVDSPHGCGIGLLTVCVLFLLFFEKKVESG